MRTRRMRLLLLLVVGVCGVSLLLARNPPTEATSPTLVSFEYKVELIKHKQDLEGRLREDSRSGWRLHSIAATSDDNGLVAVLEKASAP